MDTPRIKNERTPPLYQVVISVRLASIHPFYFSAGDGYLSLWLFDDLKEQAGFRALEILKQLPFELAGEHISIVGEADPSYELFLDKTQEAIARECGFAFKLNLTHLEHQFEHPK